MNNSNWLSDKPVDEWYGIRVDADGQGNALTLQSNRLSGEIPPELGGLVNLKGLNLSRNQVERGDSAGIGRPRQLERAEPLREPVERGDSA